MRFRGGGGIGLVVGPGFGSKGGGLSVPAALTDGNTVARYKYNELSTITKDGSNIVSRINDMYGSGNDLVTGSCGWSAIDGLTGNGLDQMIRSAGFTYAQPEYVYLVMKQKTWTVNDRIVDGVNNASMAIYQLGVTPNIAAYGGGGNLPAAGYTALALDTWAIVTVLFNGASSRWQVDMGAVSTDNPGTAAAGGITLFGAPGGANYANAYIKDAIFRKVADSVATRDTIYNYLKALHGV